MKSSIKQVLFAGLGATAIALAGCAQFKDTFSGGHQATAGKLVSVNLTGAEEVPAVTTTAQGSGSFTVFPDRRVTGSISVQGIAPTMAHIHIGRRGANGPVAIGLVKTDERTWSVPAGAALTDAQYQSYVAGEAYVNVHSAKYPGGEIRAQIRP
jgi:hypothetical protein